jgi:hypothetical protein
MKHPFHIKSAEGLVVTIAILLRLCDSGDPNLAFILDISLILGLVPCYIFKRFSVRFGPNTVGV